MLEAIAVESDVVLGQMAVCLVRQKAIKLTPEEAIRQLYLRVLTDHLHYPISRIQVEYGVNFGVYRRIVPKDEEGLSEKEKERQFLLDPHDHLIVDHDLYNHEGLTEDVTELEVNGIISSEIMLVRLTSVSKQTVFPEYVSLFLNSKFGYLQVERRVHGVAYYSISQPDLANLLIPIFPKPQQQNIVEKIKSSFASKLKSKQLLEIAKTGVERAIETDEATARTWMNQQLEALGVTLT